MSALAARVLTRVSAALLLAALVAGCIEVDAQLAGDGSAKMKMIVSNLDEAGDASIRKQLLSPAVKVVGASYADGRGTYQLEISDIDKLRTAAFFRQIRIEQEESGSTRQLTILIPRRPPVKDETNLPGKDYVVVDLRLKLPERVVASNGKKEDDQHVRWQVLRDDMLGKGYAPAEVSYGTAAKPGG